MPNNVDDSMPDNVESNTLPVALRRVRPPVQDRRPYAGADTFPVRKTFEIVEHGRR